MCYLTVYISAIMTCSVRNASSAQLQRQESGGALPRLASDSSAIEDSLTLSFTLQPSTNGDTAAMMSAMDMVCVCVCVCVCVVCVCVRIVTAALMKLQAQ